MIRRLLPFILAAVLGLVAVVLTQLYLFRQRRAFELERQKFLAEYQNPLEVVVASHDIPKDKVLEEADIASSQVPKKFVQPYATSTPQDVIGWVALAPIAQGEQILRTKVVQPGEEGAAAPSEPLSLLTPEGKRAVTLGTDVLKGVGGFVQPGDTVDILWTFKPPPSKETSMSQETNEMTITLFQDVSVLAVDKKVIGQPQVASKESGGSSGKRDFNLTLALTPQESSVLAYARENGRIELTLRPQLDKDRQVALNPVTLPRLMEAVLGTPQMKDKPARERSVEVFKGIERSVISVPE